jgi:hypothetical protein
VGLLRRLAEWSQDGSLTLPNTESHATAQSRYTHKNQFTTAYSAAHDLSNVNAHADKTPAQIAKDKLAGDIAYLHRIAALSPDESIVDVAKDAGIEYVLPHIDC